MCIILFAYNAHPKYNLILLANRDEYYARQTSRAALWEDAPDILGGRDLEHGGTWLGVTKQGRVAAVTNFRDPSSNRNGAPSRGFLVSDFLRSIEDPHDYLMKISSRSADYNGFNLIVGDPSGLYYLSNRLGGVANLAPGIYGLSNHLIDTPWPKVVKGKQSFREIIDEGREVAPAALLKILADGFPADDAALPKTGISLEYERALSSIFIHTPEYGTRSSTILLIATNGETTFVERTFKTAERSTDVTFEFRSNNDF